MKYYVTFAVDGTITKEFEASSDAEARKIVLKKGATLLPDDVHFGDLENCSVELIQADNESGEIIYGY